MAIYDIIAKLGLDDKDFQKKLQDVTGASESTAKKMDAALTATMLAVGAAIYKAVSVSADFEIKMQEIGSLLGPENTDRIKLYNDQMLRMSQVMPLNLVTDMATGMYNIVSATVPVNDQMFVLEQSSMAAVAGVAELTETFNLGSAIVKGYGFEFSEIDRVYDVVFQTIKDGQTTMGELAGAMGGVVPIANTMGVSFEELAGGMATLAGVTGTTSEAATQLQGLMGALLKPTLEMEDAFSALGVASGQELINKMGGLSGAMDALKGYTEETGIGIGKLIGRREALTGFFALTGPLAEDFATKTNHMSTAFNLGGQAAEAFDIIMDSFSSQLKLSKNIVQSIAIDFGEGLLPSLTSVLKTFNEHPEAIKTVINIMGELGTLIVAVGGSWKAFNLIASASNVLTATLATTFGPIGIALAGAATAFTILNGIVKAHNQAIINNIDQNSKDADSVDVLARKYDYLTGKAKLTKEESNALTGITADLQKKFDEVGLSIDGYGGKMSVLANEYRKLKQEKLEEQLSAINTELEHANTVQESLRENSGWATALSGPFGSLTNNLQEVNIASGELVNKQAALKKEIEELSNKEKILNDVGVETTKSINEQIDAFKAALPAAEGDALATKNLKDEIAKLEEKVKAAVLAQSGQIDVQKMLKDLNIETSESVQTEIDKYELLLPKLKEGTLQYKTVKDRLSELYLKMDDNESWLKLNTNITNLDDAFKGINTVTGNVRHTMSEIPETLKPVDDSFIALGISAVDTKGYFEKFWQELDGQDFARYAGQVSDVAAEIFNLGPNAKEGLGILTEGLQGLLTGSLDPISLGIKAIGFAFKAFGSDNKIVVRSIEDVKKSLGSLYLEIEKFGDVYDSIGIKSGMIDNINDSIDGYLETLKTATGDHRALLEQMVSDARNRLADILNLFSIDFDLTNTQDDIDKLISQITRIYNLFGETADYSGAGRLLEEQLLNLFVVANQLNDVTAPAFDNVKQRIQDVFATFANIGQMDVVQRQLATMLFGLSSTRSSLGATSVEAMRSFEKIKAAFVGLANAGYDSTQIMNMVINESGLTIQEYLKQMQMSQAQIDELMSAITNGFTEIPENASPAVKEVIEQINELEGTLADLVKQKFDLTQSFILNKEKLEDKISDIQSTIEDLTAERLQVKLEFDAKIETVKSKIYAIREIISDIRIDPEHTNLYEMEKQIELLTGKVNTFKIAWDEATGSTISAHEEMMQSMREMMGDSEKGVMGLLDQVEYYGLAWDQTDIDEKINYQIQKMKDFIGTLDPDSQAAKDATAMLNALIARFQEMGGVVDAGAAYDFGEEEAKNQLDILMQQLADLKAAATSEDNSYQLKIDEAQANLDELELELQDLIDNYSQMTIQIDADILAAQEELETLRQQLAALLNNPNNPPSPNEPPAYHYGGVVRAHSGMFATDEIPAILKRNEVVIPEPITKRFDDSFWRNAIATGNFNTGEKNVSLENNVNIPIQVEVITTDPNPQVNVRQLFDYWDKDRQKNKVNVDIFQK